MGRNDEKALQAASQVFLRFGYKKTTMADLAAAASMSRPALYLVFPSKQAAFIAVMGRTFSGMLSKIRQGIGKHPAVHEKLMFAFEVWCVEPFGVVLKSPDAKDLLESSYEFAPALTTRAWADFVGLVASELEPLRPSSKARPSSRQVAEILVSAVPGFKTHAKTQQQLRKMIATLVSMALTGIKLSGQQK